MTDPLGQSQVIPYLAGLTKKGFHITLLSAEKQENYQKHHQQISELLKIHQIKWVPVNYTKSPPVLSTLKDIRTLIKTAKKLHKKQSFSIVHCRSYIAAFVGQYMKKKFGVKFLFDMRGFWPDERVDGKIWNLSNPVFAAVYRYFKNKEAQFLQDADAVVSLTNAGKTEMIKWKDHFIKPEKISIIPCCADLNHFDYNQASKAEDWRKKLRINPKHYVLNYLGSIGTWYMLHEMLQFFKSCLSIQPNSVFLFITKDNPEIIQSKARSIGIDLNKIIITPAERNELPNMLSICNASLFFIKPVWSKKASSPTKMAELMGMGIPIIANAGVGDVDELITENPNGILLNEFSEQAYIDTAKHLFEMIDIDKAISRKLAIKHFSLKGGIERYATIYQKLI